MRRPPRLGQDPARARGPLWRRRRDAQLDRGEAVAEVHLGPGHRIDRVRPVAPAFTRHAVSAWMIGADHWRSVSPGIWEPIPWTKTTRSSSASSARRVGRRLAALDGADGMFEERQLGGGLRGLHVGQRMRQSCLGSVADSPAPRRRYHGAVYLDALSFLEDERDAWRPFEALLELSDEQLEAR